MYVHYVYQSSLDDDDEESDTIAGAGLFIFPPLSLLLTDTTSSRI